MSKPVVLVVDDSLTVRMDLSECFAEVGFEVRASATLADARQTLASAWPDVLVLDLLLPDGDGLDLLRELRADTTRPALPVLLLSSEAEVGSRVRGLRSGANEFVGKPYDQAHLVARAQALVQRTAGASERPARASVLVVDDSQTFREHLRELLEAEGYRVYAAPTGEEGLRMAAYLRPDVLVVDGVLPGIDGPTVIRRLRGDAALRSTPCLMLTGSEGKVSELFALDAGADAWMRKGAAREVVLARLAALCRESARRAVPEAARSLLAPKRVLVVDDSRTFLEALSSQLREDGYEVVVASAGEEALELLAVQPVDGILLDLMMPGLSGFETCRRIKESPALRGVPLLILTAREDHASLLEAVNVGADDFITKASDFAVLEARLRAQLRRKQFEDENRRVREQLAERESEALEARAHRELAEARAALLADLERKNVELAQANRELEAFSYSLSHDLRAPLRTISGFNEILLEDYSAALDPQGQQLLRWVREAVDRMDGLVDGMLALTGLKVCALEPEAVDLSALARSVLEKLQKTSPARTVETLVAEECTAWGDRRLLLSVLENLLGNAWKYTAKAAEARVEFGVPSADAQGWTRFFVRDNGAGFDMARASKLFTPFQRLHSQAEFAGTGIGLATVQRIVLRHGGELTFESAPGRGTTFSVALPPEPKGE